jgi:hypothetical protein
MYQLEHLAGGNMADRGMVDEKELDEIQRLAPAGSAISFQLEQGRDGRAWVRPDEAAEKAHRAVPRLVETVRRLRREVEEAREEAGRLAQKDKTPPRALPDPEKQGAAEALGSLLSAPFNVSPRAISAAKDDPLKALAVQVARALGEGASDVERARLIAMALAASQGEMDRFWEARRQRAPRKTPARKK